jgi:hypothetical protein
MRLVVVVESPEQRGWCSQLDLGPSGVIVDPLEVGEAVAGGDAARRRVDPRDAERDLPSFDALLAALGAPDVEACMVLGDSPAARMASLAADLRGLPTFTLVTTRAQLANLGARSKPRPDLFFVADEALLPDALLDPRYGSTLLPVGDPATAGPRVADAIDRWRRDALDPRAPELSVIVPAYREGENLPMVCERLLEALEPAGITYEILLVDDASPDDTFRVARAQMLRSARIRSFSKPLPRGMGNAIRYGLERARAPIVAVTMGDGSDEVSRIPEMFARVHDDGFGLAIGSRYRHRVNYQTVPRLYRFWSSCFRLCTRLAIGLRLSDYTNAFRVFDRRIFARYGPESGGFEISPETTFKAWFATRRVTEVDVRHLKRAAGQSSFSFLRAGPGYGKILTKAFVNRLTGRWFTLDW